MSPTPISLEPMQSKFIPALCELLIAQFRQHFKQCHTLSDVQLRHFFEKKLEASLLDPSHHHIVARQGDTVVGSLLLAWKPEFDQPKKHDTFVSKESIALFGKWDFAKLWLSLHLLEHKPQLQECYIAHLLTHPHPSKNGVDAALLQYASDFAHNDPRFDLLTVHVAGKNEETTRLYARCFFKTCLQKSSLTRSLLFGDARWNFMTLPLK